MTRSLVITGLAVGVLMSCSESDAPEQLAEPLSLFSEDFEKEWQKNREEYEAEGSPTTELNSEIQWSNDIYEAIERATAEDKPIFVANFVRENGDPACDV